MATTIVDTWVGTDISALGPIYPFVGSEVVLWIVGLAFWLGFHVLQMRHETAELAADAEAASHKQTLEEAIKAS